ncbi:long-chain fatty acid--CoA ligase [Phyllobacterium phragmitis]|uniref:Long-chain-fatty-acid--CoA ligase n=1 Tax=Phyllobacterium phragmitis TaxID=2670329 RepID=A0A2S9IM97_9HYPH|nr:long-chain fatty acid--CoA ligase [Phyllobacterium phragmitis]PRD41637.1 long-chain fatty acid--CoA ligase [Phyllobacterium phragmitis]
MGRPRPNGAAERDREAELAKKVTSAEKPATKATKSPTKTKAAKPAAAKTAASSAKRAATKAPAAKAAPKRSAAAPTRPWLKSYATGVPAEIETPSYSSIGDLIVSSCRKYADRPSFTSMGKTLTYAELEERSTALAAWLQSRGLVKGDRVALMMPNVLQYPVAIAAVLRAGLVAVNVNPLYTPRELEHQLNDAGAKAIIILENFATTLENVLPRTEVKHIVVASMGDMLGLKGHLVNFVVRKVKKMVPTWSLPDHVPFKTALAEGAAKGFSPVEVAPSDVAFLQYTGGTTGISKGATLLHSNILANVEQMRVWIDVAYRIKGKPKEVNFICALPLYHIFALTVNAMMGIEQGARNVLIPNPRDIPAFVKELQKYPVHILPGLNTLFNALLNNEDFRKLDFKPMVLTLGGGMAVQRPVADRWHAITGCHITEGYGLSETSPVATANSLDATDFSGTIGLPLPSTDLAIRDENGRDLPPGEVGEICIRGPQVMHGYWNRPDETKTAFYSDGFFRSGDMGFMDERGLTKIVDRKKDMILVSGFNVYPNEIEEVAAEHPGIVEAAAIGVPNEHSGEVVKLFVVRRDPGLTEDAVKAFCAERLTNYKRPREIEFRDELPKTNVGKILRRKLRDEQV